MNTFNTDDKLLYDFYNVKEFTEWKSVDDTVMGGLSQSSIRPFDECMAIFQGELSRENNGGFASVRRPGKTFDLSAYRGIAIKVKGDGKIYNFRIKTDENSSVSYQAKFRAAPDEWKDIFLPFKKFTPVFRGRILYDAPELDPARITQTGFMVSDCQEGSFRLIVDYIKAYI